jgi:hypothetical protein
MKTILKGFIYALVINALIGLGYWIGSNNPIIYRCPEVTGNKVITTIHSREGHTCVYVKHDKVYGRATKKIKL